MEERNKSTIDTLPSIFYLDGNSSTPPDNIHENTPNTSEEYINWRESSSNLATFSATNNYEPLTKKNKVYNDELTDQMIEYCSNKLDYVAKPGCVGITDCNLTKQGLKSIKMIRYHNYLTNINLSSNYLTDLSPLGSLPFLNSLDVSHNLLSTLLDFEAPVNLRYVDFSYNLVDAIRDLSEFWSLEHLDVSHNLIKRIGGLENLNFLKYLDLSYNYIKVIEGLSTVNLTYLFLDYNEIGPDCEAEKDSGTPYTLDCLSKCIKVVSMSFNKLDTLKPFENMPKLEKLNLSNNNIGSLGEVMYLQGDTSLFCVDLRENPVQATKVYQDTIIHCLRRLRYLDGYKIDYYKKGKVEFHFSTDKEVVARNYNAVLSIILNMETPTVDDSILPNFHKSPPMIVLVGPTGSKKKRLIQLVKMRYFKNKLCLGVSHTTRPKSPTEVHGVDYHFVSKKEFNEGLERGKFITSVRKYGHYFGIQEDELEKAKNTQAIIFATDLNAGLQLKEKYQQCILIFAMPESEQIHRESLIKHFRANQWASTFISAYIIAYEATKTYSRRGSKRMERKCTSILDTIIQYIEQIHEGKVAETEESLVGDADHSEISPFLGDVLFRRLSTRTENEQDHVLPLSWTSMVKKDYPNVSFVDSSQSLEEASTVGVDTAAEQESIESVLVETSVDDKDDAKKSEKSPKVVVIKASDKGAVKTPSGDTLISTRNWLNAPSYDSSSMNLEVGCGRGDLGAALSYPEGSTTHSESVMDAETHSVTTTIDYTVTASSKRFQSIDMPYDEYERQPHCLKLFIEDQIKVREMYREAFCNKPGYYFARVHTDHLDEAAEHIRDIINVCVERNAAKNKEWKESVEKVKCTDMFNDRRDSILKSSS